MSLIKAEKGRGKTVNLTIYDGAGDVITPSAGDKIRVYIGRGSRLGTALAGAQFLITSDADSAAGSSLTKGATNVLRMDATDLNFSAGIYSLWFEYFNNADASEWKMVDRQVFYLEEIE